MNEGQPAPEGVDECSDRLPRRCDVLVIGAGIVGLATAHRLSERHPGIRIAVVEKERAIGLHQSGRNSNVIHAGVYYRPGSLRAALCRRGKEQLERFLSQHGIPHLRCGKLIVATTNREVSRLDDLAGRAAANGVRAIRLDREGVRSVEPECAGIAALHVAESGVTEYPAVMRRLTALIRERGHAIVTGCRVERIVEHSEACIAETDAGTCEAGISVACAGLHSDRVARRSGMRPPARIIPFRGEYFELAPHACHLVKGLIYPVPDPSLPFLGVHLTITATGGVECGPNAVLAFAREGYRFGDVNARDLAETMAYPGFWRLAAKHWRSGLAEMRRSLDSGRFCASLQALVPAIRAEDLRPVPAGVRAQAVGPDGAMLDDFLIERRHRMVHVCNAPSPAATACLAIADAIIDRLDDVLPPARRSGRDN
jgi:L-2-hydroxyglutarate oxidase